MLGTDIYNRVQSHYGAAAKSSTDGSYSERVAKEFGYSKEELDSVPQEANLGLSCGNPLALAKLREGETVVDLGSGAGFDVFQAAKKIGPQGKAIGIDMNEDMLQRANQIKTKLSASNVEFVRSNITSMNLATASADCIISNCVINLVPEDNKQLAFNEMYRVLKPRGRVAVSDILAKGELPREIKNSMALYVGCIAGASQLAAYERYLRNAGFADVLIVDTKSDLNIYHQRDGTSSGYCAPLQVLTTSGCCGPVKTCKPAQAETVANSDDIDFNKFVGSYKIFAIKE